MTRLTVISYILFHQGGFLQKRLRSLISVCGKQDTAPIKHCNRDIESWLWLAATVYQYSAV
jgi:hypothetical protein